MGEWVSVSEGAGGGGRRKADTELKTKTPHVNVGNDIYMGEGAGGALSRETSRDVLGEPRNTC